METWTSCETDLLIKLYVKDELELLNICKIMKKKCKVIINKLIELDIVKSKDQIRGTNLNYKPIIQDSLPVIQGSLPIENYSLVQYLNGINQVVKEVVNICNSYSKIINQINSTK